MENKKQQQITAEEIRKLIQKSLVAGNGEVTDNTAAGFERQIQDMLSCLSEKVQGKEKEAKQKQDLEKLIIEREKTSERTGKSLSMKLHRTSYVWKQRGRTKHRKWMS